MRCLVRCTGKSSLVSACVGTYKAAHLRFGSTSSGATDKPTTKSEDSAAADAGPEAAKGSGEASAAPFSLPKKREQSGTEPVIKSHHEKSDDTLTATEDVVPPADRELHKFRQRLRTPPSEGRTAHEERPREPSTPAVQALRAATIDRFNPQAASERRGSISRGTSRRAEKLGTDDVEFMANDADEVARAYSVWAEEQQQASVKEFLHGSVQAYHALGYFVDTTLRAGVPAMPETMFFFWKRFIKEHAGVSEVPASAGGSSLAGSGNGVGGTPFFSNQYSQQITSLLQSYTKDKLASFRLRPTHPLCLAGKGDVVIEAELTRFEFAEISTPPEPLASRVVGFRAEMAHPSTAANMSSENAKDGAASSSSSDPVASANNGPSVRASRKSGVDHTVHVDVLMTVLVPPRRFVEHYDFFHKRVVECDDRCRRMSLAKALAVGGAYPLIKALDVFVKLFTGEHMEVTYVPRLFSMLYPEMANPIPVVRKIVTFTLHPYGHWVIDDVAHVPGPEEFRVDRPDIAL